MRYSTISLAIAAVLLASGANAMNDEQLKAALETRFRGDRTGACVAAAVITKTTTMAFVCADPDHPRPIDEHTVFEIGSVTKTMTATLLADLIRRGVVSLDDPLADLLPTGTHVPAFEGKPITLAHVVTHTSGLPPLPTRMPTGDPDNPYARLSEQDLLGSLSDVSLTHAPGSEWQYSNFAMMLLSYAIANKSGRDFETLLRERLFAPLGMQDSFVARQPAGVRVARGHLSNGRATSAWDIPVNMAGVGGVRSSLADMALYVKAHLGRRQSTITPAIEQTQRQVADVAGHSMAMNWVLVPVNGRTIHTHEGGTGGFSAMVAFDREHQRGVVLLADTALTSLGGLGNLGLHLLDESMPLGQPRKQAIPDAALLDALAGNYVLDGGLKIALIRKENTLMGQAQGQPAFTMAYDTAGDFYPLEFDALMQPRRLADGRYEFTWFQGGGVLQARRTDSPVQGISPPPALSAADLAAYEGTYALTAQFAIKVSVDAGRLYVQGTGQPRIAVVAVASDVFVAAAVGAEISFARDATGRVTELLLKQAGQNLRGKKL